MKFWLSKLIPVRFTSEYGVPYGDSDKPEIRRFRDSWWQHRDRVFRLSRTRLA